MDAVGPTVSAGGPATGERIRVVRLITRMNIGGPAIHVTLLTERLDPLRYESLLVTGREDRDEGNYLTLNDKRLVPLVVVPGFGREIRGLPDGAALMRIVRLLQRVRPHIVHTHTAKAGTLGRLAAWLCRVPVVVHTYHGHVLQGYFSPAKARLFLTIERWLGRRTDRLLAVSKRVRHELLDLGIGHPDRFEVLPLGLDLDRFLDAEARRGELRGELGYTGREVLVGIVARLVPIKAHEMFLNVAAALAQRLPDIRFIVVGDGERRAALQALAGQLGIGERVRFLGWRRDLERVYADLDAVVLTSRNEGSPVSLIEAMAAGRPVVATRVGGVPDLVEDGLNGLLVAADDVAAMARALVDVLTSPDRGRGMGEAGRKRVYPAFRAQRLITDVDRLYGQLLANVGR